MMMVMMAGLSERAAANGIPWGKMISPEVHHLVHFSATCSQAPRSSTLVRCVVIIHGIDSDGLTMSYVYGP